MAGIQFPCDLVKCGFLICSQALDPLCFLNLRIHIIHEIWEILLLIKNCQRAISLNTIALPILIFLWKSDEDYARPPNSFLSFNFLYSLLYCLSVLYSSNFLRYYPVLQLLHLFLCNPPTISKSSMWFFLKNSLLSFDSIFVLCSYFSSFLCFF